MPFYCGICGNLVPSDQIGEHALKHVQEEEKPDGKKELMLLKKLVSQEGPSSLN